jgi:hypothetical protein
MFRADNRTISPSAVAATYSQFVFTAWNNNGNNAPYADGIHFRTYGDSSGGNDNLLVLKKDGIGMRLWQQTYGSTTPYSVYKDVAFIQDVVTSFNGLTGAVSGVTTSAANTFTALNTFNAGINSSHLNVTNGVTFASTSVHTGLGTFNAGITSNHLYVTSGATFASGLSVTGGTAYFFRDVYLATGANHPGIVDYEYAANMGITYPSASTPAYTVGDKWSNGSIEYTWNGSAWIENTDNIFSSTPIDFNSIVPSQSITRAKLSPNAPFSWDSSYFTPGSMKGFYGDIFILPYGVTAAYYFSENMLTTKHYVDTAVQGVIDYEFIKHITKVTAQVAGANPRPNVTVPFTTFPMLGRKHYVKWSITIANGDRWGTLTMSVPLGSIYGIEVSNYYPPTLSTGSNIWTQTVTTYSKLLSNGNYFVDSGETLVIRIDQGAGGSSTQTVFGIFAYELVPSLFAYSY